MYLLNTKTLTLKSFNAEIPNYAILSHTWGKKEVMFEDIQNRAKDKSNGKLSGDGSEKNIPGNGSDREVSGDGSDREAWEKVKGACAQAQKHYWEWIWIDSCCIDRSSSAELSENINSMYRLYEDARVCYVHLSDVDPNDPTRKSDFGKSRWFTRGWTLQELIAPSASVVFFDRSWKEIGTRYSLRDAISAITSIPVGLLEDGDLTRYSIAQKMSWAAFRETTRPEDRAYSLMGLFDICMPPIYGEGATKAFMRLQQEIIKTSDDRSIFAWVVDCERDWQGVIVECDPRGLLARSPDEFKASGRVGISSASFAEDTSFSFNNNGLRIYFPVIPISDGIVQASLNCQVDRDIYNIYLRKTTGQHYVRYHPDKLLLRSLETTGIVQEVVVKEIPLSRKTRRVNYRCNDHVRLLSAAEKHFEDMTCIKDDGPGALRNWSKLIRTVNLSCRHSDEKVRVSFPALEEGGGILRMTSSNSLKMALVEGSARYADRLRMELGCGGIVTAAVHITGQVNPVSTAREIEIDYMEALPKEKIDFTTSSFIPTLRCPQSQLIQISNPRVEPFPPNHSDRRSSRHFYLSLSKEAPSACRILAQTHDAIAIGLNESGEVWVHNTPKTDKETIEEIWESYQKNGSRAQFKGNTSSTIESYRKKTATVYKNDGLQFASHSLILTRT